MFAPRFKMMMHRVWLFNGFIYVQHGSSRSRWATYFPFIPS